MRHRIDTRSRWAPMALALAVALPACDGSTEPELEFDPTDAAESLETVMSAAGGSEDALVSIQMAGEALASEEGTAAALVPANGTMAGLLPRFSSVRTFDPAGQFFPSNYLGKTFVYDLELGRYAVDEEATGAPENGVRFIYYAIDPVTKRPVKPLVELGRIDLTDESSAASSRLGIEVVSTSGEESVTLVDYFIDVAYAEYTDSTEVTARAEGYLSDGVNQLLFDLSQSGTVSETSETYTIDIEHALELPGEGLTVALTANGILSAATEEAVEFDATLTLTKNGQIVGVEITKVGEDGIEGTVTLNGATVILIGGTDADPEFTTPDGGPLGSTEIQALLVLHYGFENVLEFASDIFSGFGES